MLKAIFQLILIQASLLSKIPQPKDTNGNNLVTRLLQESLLIKNSKKPKNKIKETTGPFLNAWTYET